MFITDNIIPFFGRKIKVLNFHTKKYLNPKASKRYNSNYRVLKNGKLIKEFGEWLKTYNMYKTKFVILGLFSQRDMDKLIEFTNHYLNLSFYVYSTKTYYNLTAKKENFRVIYISPHGNRYHDNTVYLKNKFGDKVECPKFNINRPCDTCLKCIFTSVVIPQKVVDYLF